MKDKSDCYSSDHHCDKIFHVRLPSARCVSFIVQLTRYTPHRMAVSILLEITLSEIFLVVKTRNYKKKVPKSWKSIRVKHLCRVHTTALGLERFRNATGRPCSHLFHCARSFRNEPTTSRCDRSGTVPERVRLALWCETHNRTRSGRDSLAHVS